MSKQIMRIEQESTAPRKKSERTWSVMHSQINDGNKNYHALLNGDDLPPGKYQLLIEYRDLARREKITEVELSRIQEIVKIAADDEDLLARLELVDELETDVLADEELFSEDITLRTYLSEHLGTLAQSKLRESQSLPTTRHKDESTTEFIMLCPDGSGYTTVIVGSNDIMSPEKIMNQLCTQCNAPLNAHKNVRIIPGGIPSI